MGAAPGNQNGKGHGAPTKFCKEVVLLAEKYANGGWKDKTTVVPTIEGLSFVLEVAAKTIYEWLKKSEKDEKYKGIDSFRKSIKKILAEQAKITLNLGLTGEFNSTIAKLVLSTNHGYKERSETENKDTVNIHILSKEQTKEVNDILGDEESNS